MGRVYHTYKISYSYEEIIIDVMLYVFNTKVFL